MSMDIIIDIYRSKVEIEQIVHETCTVPVD